MRIEFDEASAAFGLFHMAFAHLHQELAKTVFRISHISDTSVTFEKFRGLPISRVRKTLTKELAQFEELLLINVCAQDLRNTCSKIEILSAWRNERVHARVQIDEKGIAIFDARTLKRLVIDRDECVQKIEEALGLAFRLQMDTRSLLQELEAHHEWQGILDEAFAAIEVAESEDG
jgi:hypothetical protein